MITETLNHTDTLTYDYDPAGQLIQAGSLSLVRQSENGLLTASTLQTITDTWTYNGYGEPMSYQAVANGMGMIATEYVRDDVGRISQKVEAVVGTTMTTTYAYDTSGRLAEIQENGTIVAQYGYDAKGNRLAYTDTLGIVITATYDAQDRLLTYGSNVYTYTANGDLQAKVDTTTNQTTTFTYDPFSNLLAVSLPDGTEIENLIDGQNRRIGKLVDGILTQGFLYKDQLNPVAELDGNGEVVARFVYASRPHVPDYMVKDGNLYRILTDHLGSPRLVVNADTGVVIQQMTYDAFGNVISDTNPGFQPFGFAGGIYDQHTKLTRFGVRDYDGEVGRWTTKDPLGFAGGDTNLYVYVANDSVNFIDPTGEFWWLVGAGIGAGIDLGVQLALNGGDWSQVNWYSVGLSGAAGALGFGLGAGIARLTTNLAARIALNAVGSGFIGGALTYLGNILQGECDLWKNVWETAILNGILGGIGGYAGDKLSQGLGTYVARRDTYNLLQVPIRARMPLIHSYMLTRPFISTSPIAWGTTIGNGVGLSLSNAGPSINFFSQIGYFRPAEPGCSCP